MDISILSARQVYLFSGAQVPVIDELWTENASSLKPVYAEDTITVYFDWRKKKSTEV